MALSFANFRQLAISNPMKLVYSILILFNHFTFGMNVNILGATLVDLRKIYDVDVNTMSYVPICVGVGYLLGALTGILYKWLNRQLMLSLFVCLIGLTIAFVPHYPNLYIGLPAFVINGIGSGGWDPGSSSWMVEMWPVGNSGMLQLIQFFYGCGSVLAPLMVSPFVYGEKNVTKDNVTITPEDRIHSLTLPFAINGIALLVVPVIMLILFVTKPYDKNSIVPETDQRTITKDDPFGHSTDFPRRKMPYRIVKLAMCGICLATYASAELGWFGFSTAMYQYLPIQLSAKSAAHVQSVLSATFTGGRLLTAFITLKVIPDYILSYHYAIAFSGLATLFFGRDSEVAIYVGSAMLGFGYAACWPAILALTQRHLRLSDRVCSLYSFLTGLLSMVIPGVLGIVSLKEYPLLLFGLETLLVCISFTMFVLVRLWIWKDGSIADGTY